MNAIDNPAVVLTGNLGKPSGRSINESALAVTKSLGRQGIRVFRFHPDKSLVDLSSRYCTHVRCPNLYDDPSGLVQALLTFAIEQKTRPVLFSASDGASQFIADHEQTLKEHFLITSPSAACIAKTQHKRELIELARSMRFPVPKTFFPTEVSELPAIAATLSYPVIVKPVYSPDWKRAEVVAALGKHKALKITEARLLIEQCQILLALKNSFMIQEIVPGPDENLITFLGYFDRSGRVLAGAVRKKLRQFPPEFGYCCTTESVDDPEVFDLAVKLMDGLGYAGIGCIEFKRDPRDGVPKLIEINTRAVRTSMLAIAAGVDFPLIAYRDSVNPGSVQPVLRGKVPVRWVHLRDEIWAAWSLLWHGQLSFFAWAGGFFGKPIVLAEFSLDDMWPGILLWSHIPTQLLKHLRKRRSDSGKERAPAPLQRLGNRVNR